jgi:hypothetical protein
MDIVANIRCWKKKHNHDQFRNFLNHYKKALVSIYTPTVLASQSGGGQERMSSSRISSTRITGAQAHTMASRSRLSTTLIRQEQEHDARKRK